MGADGYSDMFHFVWESQLSLALQLGVHVREVRNTRAFDSYLFGTVRIGVHPHGEPSPGKLHPLLSIASEEYYPIHPLIPCRLSSIN